MEFILVALLSLFLLFLLLAVLVVIFFALKRSQEKKVPFTVFVVSASGSPLGGVDVKFGDEISTTDSYGKAKFSAEPGEKELLIIAEGHSDFRQVIRAGESRLLQAKLLQDKPSPEYKALEEAISSARRGRDEIGAGYNPAIPDYLFGVCLAVHKAVLEEAKRESGGKARSEMLKSAVFSINQTAKGMVERRNLSLYAKSKGKKPRQAELPQFRSADIFAARQKLAQVDLLITHGAGKSAIYPPLVLWKASQKLLADPSIFNIKLATFLLDSAEKMFAELGDFLD